MDTSCYSALAELSVRVILASWLWSSVYSQSSAVQPLNSGRSPLLLISINFWFPHQHWHREQTKKVRKRDRPSERKRKRTIRLSGRLSCPCLGSRTDRPSPAAGRIKFSGTCNHPPSVRRGVHSTMLSCAAFSVCYRWSAAAGFSAPRCRAPSRSCAFNAADAGPLLHHQTNRCSVTR